MYVVQLVAKFSPEDAENTERIFHNLLAKKINIVSDIARGLIFNLINDNAEIVGLEKVHTFVELARERKVSVVLNVVDKDKVFEIFLNDFTLNDLERDWGGGVRTLRQIINLVVGFNKEIAEKDKRITKLDSDLSYQISELSIIF